MLLVWKFARHKQLRVTMNLIEQKLITINVSVVADLCDGDPFCVKFCAYGTLEYVDAEQLNKEKQFDAAEKIYELSSKNKISLSNIKAED